jgi:glycosyltransferase involved in cell wall biosynthesis
MAYEEQPALYAASDLTLNFPEMDAFPVTILESLACGIPVLSNRLKAYESNGVMPYLNFTAEDSIAGLGEAMTAALTGMPRLQAIAADGRAHIVQNFDERVSAAELGEIYKQLLFGVPARRSSNPARSPSESPGTAPKPTR